MVGDIVSRSYIANMAAVGGTIDSAAISVSRA